MAGVQGARDRLLSGRLTGAGAAVARRHGGVLWRPAVGDACLQDDFEACIAHLRFPLAHRRAIRTTNLLERLFGEERRRTKVIPHAFGERAVLKLMYAALIRAAERWRGLRMTEFECRQLTTIRNELDRAHAERTAPVVNANVTASPTRLSSKTRTCPS